MTDKDEGFLSRWSRRKNSPNDELEQENQQSTDKLSSTSTPVSEDISDSDESEALLWQQDDVDEDIKQQALAALFKQPEFNDVDHMNEYDEDFTKFSGLGDVVTQEMKRMLHLAEEKTRPELTEEKQQDIADSQAEESDNDEQDNEEDKLA